MAHATPCFEYLYEFTRFHLFFFLGRSRELLAKSAGLDLSEFSCDGEFMCAVMRPIDDLAAKFTFADAPGQRAPGPVWQPPRRRTLEQVEIVTCLVPLGTALAELGRAKLEPVLEVGCAGRQDRL